MLQIIRIIYEQINHFSLSLVSWPEVNLLTNYCCGKCSKYSLYGNADSILNTSDILHVLACVKVKQMEPRKHLLYRHKEELFSFPYSQLVYTADLGSWVHLLPQTATPIAKNTKIKFQGELHYYIFSTQERSVFSLKHLVIAFLTDLFFLLYLCPPLHPLLISFLFVLLPRSMFHPTSVFVTLCWSSPCQCGPCRRCWLTLGRTPKG